MREQAGPGVATRLVTLAEVAAGAVERRATA